MVNETNKIYQGDALDLIDQLMVSPNLIIMSPPDSAETKFNQEQYREFLSNIYRKCMNKLDENGVLVSITTDRKIEGKIYTKHIDIINSMKDKVLFNYKIWAKKLGTNLYILTYCHILCFKNPKSRITNNKVEEWYPDVLLIERDKIKGYPSKDSFPSKLIDIIVRNYSRAGDLVLDPFLGSGKTAKVCNELNRKWIGFELLSSNIEIADTFINGKSKKEKVEIGELNELNELNAEENLFS